MVRGRHQLIVVILQKLHKNENGMIRSLSHRDPVRIKTALMYLLNKGVYQV